MNLNDMDYRSMIARRCESIKRALYSNGNNAPEAHMGGGYPQRQYSIPDFADIRQDLDDLNELIREFENHLGPA